MPKYLDENINNTYYGDSGIRHRIVFERRTMMNCVFCGEIANTREHTPSKIFLETPLPTDIMTVPSCDKCNNGFSSDELYTKHILYLYIINYLSKKTDYCQNINFNSNE